MVHYSIKEEIYMSGASIADKIPNVRALQVAGKILVRIKQELDRITKEEKIMVEMPNGLKPKSTLPELIYRCNWHLTSSIELLTATHWWKFLGGMAIPWNRSGGNIHLVLVDNGYLSKAIPTVPKYSYQKRSAFYLGKILKITPEFRGQRENIHLHVFSADDVSNNANILCGIKSAVAQEHESSGSYIMTTSMLPFTLESLVGESASVNQLTLCDVGYEDEALVRVDQKWLHQVCMD